MSKTKKRIMPYTVCKTCGKTVRLRPAGGDWLNDLYPFVHDARPGVRCDGAYKAVENKDIIEDRFKP